MTILLTTVRALLLDGVKIIMSRNNNVKKFQESIQNELVVVKDRVENLIGSITHHGENGRYREAILKNVIKRFLPSSISMGTGFIVKDPLLGHQGQTRFVSTQIDIILYEINYHISFQKGILSL